MIRRAENEDLPAIERFLARHQSTSMFLSGNLRDQGMNRTGHPKAMTVWITETAGEVSNVFGYAEAGYFVFEAPNFTAQHYAGLRSCLAGYQIWGLNGVAKQAAQVLEALQISLATVSMDEVEPHYHMDLNSLVIPEGKGRLRIASDADLDWLVDWRIASEVEILGGLDCTQNRDRARAALEDLMGDNRVCVLEQDGVAVAMTAFNAVLPGIVQVGGVYTPPDLRGNGYARCAVSRHLEKARATGVKEAILFAANPAASRAYEAIGFRLVGRYRVVNFAHPVVVC